VLGNIEPVDLLERFIGREGCDILPEIQVIHRALLIPHINVEGKEIDWGEGPAAQDFKERRKAIARFRIDNVMVRHIVSGLRVGNGEITSTEIEGEGGAQKGG
jgi:hypothetical protein